MCECMRVFVSQCGVHGLWPEPEKFDSGRKKRAEMASQEEQNGANFSFVAPSSEEL